MKFKNCLLALSLAVGLSACASTSPFEQKVEYGFSLDWNDIVYQSDHAKKDTMREEQFKLNLLRVTDLRMPEDRIVLDEEHVIHDYQPAELVRGLEGYVSSSLNKYMSYPDNAGIQLGLELDIKKFHTAIEHGFLQRHGQYIVDIEVEFLVRDEQSRVLLREIVAVSKDVARGTFKGTLPSAARDKKEMRKILKEAMQDLTLDIGWTVHKAFDQQRKHYHPLKDSVEDFLDLS
jgi:hypothetical protein